MISCAQRTVKQPREPVITVSVIAAWPDRFETVSLQLPVGTTAAEARKASGLGEGTCGMAVYGVLVDDLAILQDADRLELLRPLLIDPKDARRKRAEARSVKHKKW